MGKLKKCDICHYKTSVWYFVWDGIFSQTEIIDTIIWIIHKTYCVACYNKKIRNYNRVGNKNITIQGPFKILDD